MIISWPTKKPESKILISTMILALKNKMKSQRKGLQELSRLNVSQRRKLKKKMNSKNPNEKKTESLPKKFPITFSQWESKNQNNINMPISSFPSTDSPESVLSQFSLLFGFWVSSISLFSSRVSALLIEWPLFQPWWSPSSPWFPLSDLRFHQVRIWPSCKLLSICKRWRRCWC